MVTYDVCPNLSFLNINMIYRQKILMTTERNHCTINCTTFKGAVNMPSVNYSNARQNFKELITKVNEDSVAYTITTKENENASDQLIRDAAKVFLRWKFIAIQAHVNKQEKAQINNLKLHITEL